MDQKPFRKKVAALIEYAKTEYAKVFGTPSLTIAFATPKGHHRRQSIHSWIQQELTAIHAAQSADVFRILSIPEKYLCPEEVFLSPICVRPFDTDVFPLIEC